MEEQEYIELRPQPKFALLSDADYIALNNAISAAKGYNLGEPTERYASLEPELAKVNIQHDADGNELSYETKCVMPISSELQIDYPQLIEGIELVFDYVKIEAEI